MAKKKRGKRSAESWLHGVRNNPPSFAPWKQWKYNPIAPRRQKKRKPNGNKTLGFVILGIALVIVPLTIWAFGYTLTTGEFGSILSFLLVIFPLEFLFVKAGIEHIRYSGG